MYDDLKVHSYNRRRPESCMRVPKCRHITNLTVSQVALIQLTAFLCEVFIEGLTVAVWLFGTGIAISAVHSESRSEAVVLRVKLGSRRDMNAVSDRLTGKGAIVSCAIERNLRRCGGAELKMIYSCDYVQHTKNLQRSLKYHENKSLKLRLAKF
jgi:hypothetical protein